MTSGLPVIASNVGGIPYMVEEGKTGFLVEAGSTSALAGAFRRALADRSRLAALGTEGRKKSLREYSPASVASSTVSLYRSLMLP